MYLFSNILLTIEKILLHIKAEKNYFSDYKYISLCMIQKQCSSLVISIKYQYLAFAIFI